MPWQTNLKSAIDQKDTNQAEAILALPHVVKELEKKRGNGVCVGFLNRAIKRDATEIFELIVQHTQNLDGVDSGGLGGLHAAVLSKSLDKVQYLLDRGADVGIRTRDEGDTALHLAAGQRGAEDMLKTLAANGAKVGARNGNGQTALHFAAEFGHSPNVFLLIKAGANLNVLAKGKKDVCVTPLHLAVRFRQAEATKTLLQYGADPNVEGRYEKYHGSAFDMAKQMAQRPDLKESLVQIVTILGTWKRTQKQLRDKYALKKRPRVQSQ